MMGSALVSGVAGSLLLLAAGYLIGAKRGRAARERLRVRCDALERDVVRATSAGGDGALREDLERLLAPLVERERRQVDLSTLGGGTLGRSDLVRLLDGIAQTGGFVSIHLSDASGLPVASSSDARDTERMSGIASIVFLLAERVERDGGAAPAALVIKDHADRLTLHRIFSIGGKRLLLSAVTTGAELSVRALDPALGRLERALTHVPPL